MCSNISPHTKVHTPMFMHNHVCHRMLICLHTHSLSPMYKHNIHTRAHTWRPGPAITERSGQEERDFFTSPIGPPKESPFFLSLIWLRSPGIAEPVLKVILCEIPASLSLVSDISLGVSRANAQSQFYFTIWLPQYGLEHISESRLPQFKRFLCPLCRSLVGLRAVSGRHLPHL